MSDDIKGKLKEKFKKDKRDFTNENTFAFLVHPLNYEQVVKKYRIAGKVNPKVITSVLKKKRPWAIAEIEGIQSISGQKALGWFIMIPLLPWQFMELEEDYVVEKIVKGCKVAKKQGAKLAGLGAFTAIAGNGGRQVASMADIPVTTGNTYTTTTAIQAIRKAAEVMDVNLKDASVAVVGATGSIGKACATVLAQESGLINLVGRYQESLEEVAEEISGQTASSNIKVSTDISASLKEADIVISVTGSAGSIIYPDDLKSGAIICDVARPRDVSDLVERVRNDVLVIDGGIVKVPGENVNFNLDFGPPPKMAEGCVAETIILALEGRFENYTIGKNITPQMVQEMSQLADKHGFSLAGLRRNETIITEQYIEQVKKNARKPACSL